MKFECFKIKPGQKVTVKVKLLDDVQLAPQYFLKKDGSVELVSMSVVHDPRKDKQ